MVDKTPAQQTNDLASIPRSPSPQSCLISMCTSFLVSHEFEKKIAPSCGSAPLIPVEAGECLSLGPAGLHNSRPSRLHRDPVSKKSPLLQREREREKIEKKAN